MKLADVPFVDNHAHPLTRRQPRGGQEFRAHFSEAHSSLIPQAHIASAVFYRWGLRQLGEALGLEADEERIVLHRDAVPFSAYARDLMQRANVAYLLLDEGYPAPKEAYPSAEIESMLGIRVGRILRLESLLEELIAAGLSLSGVVTAFDEVMQDIRGAGYVAIKSIAAYRTGLVIEPVHEDDLEPAFESARKEASAGAKLRLQSKPLIDYFVLRALHHAALQSAPIQFHTGYGDPDLDLRLANPLHLRPIFEQPDLSTAPIVLLHASYPFTAEAAYLAAVYPNAYLDIAFSLPPLDWFQLVEAVKTALGVAPASKLMCSSDGVAIPEHYWLGAVRARRVVSHVLGAMREAAELTADDVDEIGEMLLQANAKRVYSLKEMT